MNLFKYKDVKKELFFSSKPFPNIELNNLWNNNKAFGSIGNSNEH